jgi:hypothetical protein
MIQIGNDYENEVSNLTVREAVSSKPDATSTEVRVFLATKGLTGIAPSSIKSGDEIYTFRGSNIALILRGSPSSTGNLGIGRGFLITPRQSDAIEFSLMGGDNRVALENSLFNYSHSARSRRGFISIWAAC